MSLQIKYAVRTVHATKLEIDFSTLSSSFFFFGSNCENSDFELITYEFFHRGLVNCYSFLLHLSTNFAA